MGNGCDELPPSDNEPRSMRDPDVRARRKALLDQPHMRPLVRYVAKLRQRDNVEVPDFDPCDGGVNAQVLFLFEKPGPMTAQDGSGNRVGSGFISRNNDDPTAENTFNFMQEAGIPRELTVTWNVIPWWNDTTKYDRVELEEGLNCLKELINDQIRKLQAAVLVGNSAKKARPMLEERGLKIFESAHPSPQVRYPNPELWNSIPVEWAKVKKFINIKK